MSQFTQPLASLQQSNPKAAEELLPLVYEALRQLAAFHLSHEKPGQTLQPTALVHEAYLRLIAPDHEPIQYAQTSHFFAAAAQAMRRILIEQARRRLAAKHGGNHQRQELSDIVAPQPDDELVALEEALEHFAKLDPLKARLVELRYFAGLTNDQAAAVLDISPTTADRYWTYARAWLLTKVR